MSGNNTSPAYQTAQRQRRIQPSTPTTPQSFSQVNRSSMAPQLSSQTAVPGSTQHVYHVTNQAASITNPIVTPGPRSAQLPLIPQQAYAVLGPSKSQQAYVVLAPSSSQQSPTIIPSSSQQSRAISPSSPQPRDPLSPPSLRTSIILSTEMDMRASGSSADATVQSGHRRPSQPESRVTELLEPEFPGIGDKSDDEVTIMDSTAPALSDKSSKLGKRSTSTRPTSGQRSKTAVGSDNAWPKEALKFLVDWANVEENWTRLRRRRNVGQQKKSTLYTDISEQLLKETGIQKDALAIKNKLADMNRSFNKALKFHNETGQGDRNEQSFKDAVIQRCSFFYDVYDLWSSSLKTSTDTFIESTDDVASLSEAANSILGDITTAKESDYESDAPLKRRKTKSRVTSIRSKIDELVASDCVYGPSSTSRGPLLSLEDHLQLQERHFDARLKELAETEQTKREEEKRRVEEEKRKAQEEMTKQEIERTKQIEGEAKKAQIELEVMKLKMAMQEKGYHV